MPRVFLIDGSSQMYRAFHAPVRSADCIASIERWAKRDVFGQKLADFLSLIPPAGPRRPQPA